MGELSDQSGALCHTRQMGRFEPELVKVKVKEESSRGREFGTWVARPGAGPRGGVVERV